MTGHPLLPFIPSLLSTDIPARLADNEDGQMYMLVDGARLQQYKNAMSFPMAVKDGISLAVDSPDHDAHAVGPLLFEFEWRVWSETGREQTLDTLFRNGICSLLISTLSVDELAQHLRRYLDVTLADGTEMMMRFFDPRVLPFWFAQLPKDYAAEISSGLVGWAVVRGNHELTWLPLTPAGAAAAPVIFPLQLDARCEEKLLAECLPYALLDRLLPDPNSLLDRIPPAERYAHIATLIAKAERNGFAGMGDIENYCRLGLRHGPDFDTTAAFVAALAKMTKPFHVHDLMAMVPSLNE